MWTKLPDICISIKDAVLVFDKSKGSQPDARASKAADKTPNLPFCVQTCRNFKI